jgi:thioredoxin reductase (NADPH)
MSETTAVPSTVKSRLEHIFPTLTPAQVARIASHGSVRPIGRGEVLVEAGDLAVPFFVVTAGRIQIVRPSGAAETLVVVHGPGEFTGETNLLSGRRSLVRARVIESGEVIQLTRDRLLALVQTDPEISEILMRAFILRRVELIAHGLGDVVLIGSMHSPGSLRIKEFLTRNGHPYAYIDLDRDHDVQDCRLPRLQRRDRSGAPPRRRHRRCRTVGPRRGGVRRVRSVRSSSAARVTTTPRCLTERAPSD